MKTKLQIAFRSSPFALALVLFSTLNPQPSTFAQGTAFTYQGRLNNGGNPASGLYDLTFSLFTASNGVGQVANTLTNTGATVNNGLFTVLLDFGPGVFTGTNLWLQIGVRTNGGGSFTTLNPLQALSPAPYAIFANTASNLSGTLPAAQLAGTYGNPVAFNNGANSFNGSFYGQFFGSSFVGGNFVGNFIGTGSGLADVWHTGGNLGTTPGVNFLGTTDNQPLLVKVNGQQAMRYEPTYETPNIIGGWSGNYVQPGLPGVTIGGGGSPNPYNGRPQPNIVTNNGYYGTIAGGYNNTVKGYGGAILGGSVNFANGDFATIGGGQFHTNFGDHSFIGGGINNLIEPNYYSFIGGGFNNVVHANSDVSTIGGGGYQVIQTNAPYSFIGGGYGNIMSGFLGTIVGGWANTEASYGGIIGAGLFNVIEPNSDYAFIGGGYQNSIQTFSGYSAIGGGYFNTVHTNSGYSVIGGGYNNNIQTNAGNSFIGGGLYNDVRGSSDQSVIAGGNANVIQIFARESFVGGGFANVIQPGGFNSVIGGGAVNTNAAAYSAIVGGNNNFIQPGAYSSFIGGGQQNVVTGQYGTIGGGYGSAISNTSAYATIGGGTQNTVANNYATVGGGYQNFASGNVNGFGDSATVAGGYQNAALGNNAAVGGGALNQARGDNSAIAGGALNTNQTGYGFIGGGNQNFIESFARFSAIAGGDHNTIRSNSPYSAISGGQANVVGTNAGFGVILGGFANEVNATNGLAAGRRAKANHAGTFVWADSTDADFASTTSNQFSIRAQNGATFTSGLGGANQAVVWTPGSASWSFTSDRNTKERLTPVDSERVLEKVAKLPLSEWSYIGYAQRHIGPMAQDFHAAFPLNESDTSLNEADLHGVALAAIQGLNQKLEDQAEALKTKDARIQTLESRLADLEKAVARLAQASPSPGQ